MALFIGAASPAVAGVEPSPFRPELGASRLQVVESYGAVVTQMVGELVEVRLDALIRSDMRALAQGTERLVCQLKAMKRLVALTGKDLLDSRLGTPSEVDRRTIVAALSTMADDAEDIAADIDAYLGAAPDNTPLTFLKALQAVSREAGLLQQDIVDLMEAFEADPTGALPTLGI